MGLNFILDPTDENYGLCVNSILVACAFLVKYFCKEGYTFILMWGNLEELATF